MPHEPTLHGLAESANRGVTYLLSFVTLGIYWNNHHTCPASSAGERRRPMGNLHLLFWLSLVPFTTAWMDEQVRPDAGDGLRA
jgi:uncharacterized membrane protein